MSSYSNKKNRLWIQVMASCEAPPPATTMAMAPETILADLISSGIGTIVKSAGDRLMESDQYVIKSLVAFEPSFVIRANATSASFLLNCITLNVGPSAIPIRDEDNGLQLSFDVISNDPKYKESPVVVRIEFVESADGTAIAAQVIHWKYQDFLDPSPTPGRTSRRKITVEIKISDVDDSALLVTAMQIEADSEELGSVRPNDGERLPWIRRPVKNFTGGRDLARDQFFGPVNIQVSITEVAEPSRLAKFFGTFLGNQKTAIETLVKERLTQVLDEKAAARAKLDLLKEATTAFEEYKAAYDLAVKAKSTLDAASDMAKISAKQDLALKLATLHQKEVLARTVFDGAQLIFAPLPLIKAD